MSELVLKPDLAPVQNDPELTWLNVAIALAFIVVDSTIPPYPIVPTFDALLSLLLNYTWSWPRKIPPRRIITMSHTTLCHGPSEQQGLKLMERVLFWIVSSHHRVHCLFSRWCFSSLSSEPLKLSTTAPKNDSTGWYSPSKKCPCWSPWLIRSGGR